MGYLCRGDLQQLEPLNQSGLEKGKMSCNLAAVYSLKMIMMTLYSLLLLTTLNPHKEIGKICRTIVERILVVLAGEVSLKTARQSTRFCCDFFIVPYYFFPNTCHLSSSMVSIQGCVWDPNVIPEPPLSWLFSIVMLWGSGGWGKID